jgi:hypothetical protein
MIPVQIDISGKKNLFFKMPIGFLLVIIIVMKSNLYLFFNKITTPWHGGPIRPFGPPEGFFN